MSGKGSSAILAIAPSAWAQPPRCVLAALEPWAGGAVLHLDPLGEELGADRVGRLPVLGLPGSLPGLDQLEDSRVPGLGRRGPPKQPEHASEPEEGAGG